MKVTKVLNSSVVLAVDECNNEVVLMGKGIGYHSKKNENIGPELIEKTFVISDKGINKDFLKLTKDTPQEYFEITCSVVEYAREKISGVLNDHIFVALTDHMHFAVQRYKDGVNIQNKLLWEVKKFYPEEFKIGEYAIKLINDKLQLNLPEEEAANIAFHFVNAQINENDMYQTMMMTNMIKDILNIVKLHFKTTFDKESLNYVRFMTHLQFFAQRILDGRINNSNDDFLYNQVKVKYPKELECAERIENYIKSTIGKSITKDEMVYLAIHINRVTERIN